MGAWSASITGNDLAQDLRSEYTAAFSHYDVQTAVQKIESYVRKEICDESDPAEWCGFFYSLADFMWKKGILTEEVKHRAVEMIDNDRGLDLWEEAGASTLNARKKALAKFRAQLISPMPEKKKIKPNVYLTDIFETGDLIAIQLQTADKKYLSSGKKKLSNEAFHSLDGKYILLQKIRCHVSWTSRIAPDVKDHWAVFRLIDGVYDDVPKSVNISALRDASISVETWDSSFSTPLFMCQSSMFYFKRRKYQLIGNYREAAIPYLNLRDADIYFGIDHERVNTDSQFIAAMKNLKI